MPYDTREDAKKEYTLKVPQHHHCRKCGNPFIGEGYYCSEQCRKTDGDAAKKSLKRYMVILVGLWAVVIAAVLVTRVF